jgi:hypothetical protein
VNRIDYLFGLARNSRLVDHLAIELAWAEHDAEATGELERRFADFRWTTKQSWSRRRQVVAKAEWMPGRGDNDANPRFVVTSLKADAWKAQPLYEQLYCARGEMENRSKECQLDLFADPGGPHAARCVGWLHQHEVHARETENSRLTSTSLTTSLQAGCALEARERAGNVRPRHSHFVNTSCVCSC